MAKSSFFSGDADYTRLDPTEIADMVAQAQAAAAQAAALAASMPTAATAAPIVDGVAAIGTATKYAREDHVHPADTATADARIANAAATATPLAAGTAAVGTGTKWAREDHVHPSDTSRTAIGRAINGLVLANNASAPNTTLDISPGNARDKDLTVDIVLATGFSKTFAAWSAGSGNGALDTGSVAASTGYHVFAIYKPSTSTTDILFSTSATAPVMPTGYTKRRRIGGFITDASGFIVKGLWRSDGSFELLKEIIVANSRSLTLQSLLSFPVPQGVKLELDVNIILNSTTSGNPVFYGMMSDPDIGARTLTVGTEWATAYAQKNLATAWMGKVKCWSNSSGQVYTWGYSATGDLNMQGFFYLMGWRDLRDEFS